MTVSFPTAPADPHHASGVWMDLPVGPVVKPRKLPGSMGLIVRNVSKA